MLGLGRLGIIRFFVVWFLLIAAAFLITTWLKRQATREGTVMLASLSAELVHHSQLAQDAYGVPWQLSAAYFHIMLTEGILGQLPTLQEVQSFAAALSEQGSDHLQTFADLAPYPQLVKKVHRQYQLLKHAPNLFSPKYLFPVRDKSYFADTWNADRDGGKRKHKGTDIFAAQGTPVYACSGGTVERLGWNSLGGKRVGIRGIDGFYYYYAHLDDYAPGLQEEKTIAAGELLGFVGHTGNAEGTPDHLHFGMLTPWGEWINPYQFLRYWHKYNHGI